ncbi:MAG: 4a-hydroxytetrahydrobiopterin dehydratase [Candidatus Saccharimonadales bacterium]
MKINERWEEVDGSLQATIETMDFMAAVALVCEVAALAEEQNHHPDIAIHDYSKVTITLTTHDVGEVTDNDYELAQGIDKLLEDL